MSQNFGGKRQAGYFLPAVLPVALLLVMPCAYSQDFAEPWPPVMPPEVVPSPDLSGQRF